MSFLRCLDYVYTTDRFSVTGALVRPSRVLRASASRVVEAGAAVGPGVESSSLDPAILEHLTIRSRLGL